MAGVPVKAEELEAIREDVQRATVEAYLNGDRTLLPELVNRLLTELGNVAVLTGPPFHLPARAMQTCVGCYPNEWAAVLLRDVQTRAISRIPWGEPTNDDEPEDHR